MPPKKGAKKKTAPKVEIREVIKYVPIDAPMSEVELAGAFNVQEDDQQRRAVTQTLSAMQKMANNDIPEMCDNHGKLAYAAGFEQGILHVQAELDKCYGWAMRKLLENAQEEAPDVVSKSY